MEETGYLTLVMNFLAPFLLGVAIAYLVLTTHRRQQDPAAQNRTNRATEKLYDKEEHEREEIEDTPRRARHAHNGGPRHQRMSA